VLIFCKGPLQLPQRFLADLVPSARNVRKSGHDGLLKFSEPTEDQRLIRGLAARLRSAQPKAAPSPSK
jgi:hypothetical protein